MSLRFSCALLPRFVRSKISLPVFVLCAVLAPFGLMGRADAQCSGTGTTTYTSTGGVSVAAGTISTSTNTITVPTLPSGSTITCVSVVLNGVTSNGTDEATTGAFYSSMNYAALMLTAPGGQKLEFLGATGDGIDGDDQGDSGSGLSNVNITVWDSASKVAPENGSSGNSTWPHTCSGSGCPVVRPSSYFNAPDNGEGNPPLGSSSQWAQTDGSATFANQFVSGGATPSGSWTLTLTDNNPFTNGDPVSVSSWSLVMTVEQTTNIDTTTSLSSNSTNDTSFTSGANSSVTLTATVSATGETPTGTVKFTDDGSTISGCSAQALSGGTTQCTTTISTEGIHTLQASYSPGSGFNASSSSPLNQFVKNHSTLSGGQYCNSGEITVDGGVITPYPSVINVGTDTTALTGTVANLTVTLNGISAASGLFPGYGFLLVAPDKSKAYNLDFMSSVGSSGSQPAVDVSFADDNPSAPVDGPLTSTTYEATDISSTADVFVASTSPAPAVPGTFNYAQPDYFGTNPLTLSQAFGGANGNGDWTLYAFNDGGASLAVNSGWCLSFVQNTGAVSSTGLTSSTNPATTGNPVTLTATVTSGGSPVTSGTVTFTENGSAPAGVSSNVVAVNGSGQAAITTSSLAEGDHDITATYSGVTNTWDPSSATLWQRENTATTISGAGTASSPAVFCNPGGITLPSTAESADNIGAASPNPSNIFVANLPGTINSVGVELENFHTGADPTIYDTSSLLVGPTGTGLDFFSGTGTNSTDLSTGNYVFEDSAGGTVPQAAFGPGSYQPTSYNSNDTFFASPSGFYTLPGTFDYSQPHSNAFTFNTDNGQGNGAFSGINPNGTWSLYFNQNIHDSGAGATGWCVDFVENPPQIAVTVPDSGTFTQGQQNASFTVEIVNNGPGATGDPSGSNPMTVTDTLNSAFSYSSFSGTGWSCSAAGQTLTCTNDFAVAESGSYPELTMNVNVSPTASGTVNNNVSASGAGASSTLSNTETLTIQPAPVLAVQKTHTGTFTQGQTAEWDITVSNTAGAGSVTSGTVNVADTLPSGYTVSGFGATSAAWSCNGTAAVSCTSTQGVAGGSSFPVIQLIVNVPASSPVSVSNTASAWGGGDLIHTNSGSAATGTDSNVPVVQVPAAMVPGSGTTPQSQGAGLAYPTNLSVKVTDAGGIPVSGVSVTFTAPAAGASGTFSDSTNTIAVSTNGSGIANAGTFVAGGLLGGYTVSATAGGLATVNFSLTNVPGPAASLAITAPPAATSGTPFNFTVTAYDRFGNQAIGYAGTVTFSSTDSSATLPAPSTLTAGAGTFSATLVTPGSQTITATDSADSLAITSSGIVVTAPNLVVTSTGDDPGLATNCTAQTTPGTGTDSSCSLRDALLYAAAAGAGNISFDATKFAAATTITLANGTLNVPSNTSVTGRTAGSGASLSNLIAVNGNASTAVFTVNSGVTGAAVSSLTVTHGSATGNGGGIDNSGTLTVSHSTISGNSATGDGGGIYNGGTLTVSDSTISANPGTGGSAAAAGGGIYNSGTLTVSDSSIAGNSAANGGGVWSNSALAVSGSTVSGNTSSGAGGGIDVAGGTLTLANSIVAGNTATAGNADIDGAYTDNGGNQASNNSSGTSTIAIDLGPLGNNGGPTQTLVPLPGSPAVCAGLQSNISSGVTTDQRGDPNTNASYTGYSAGSPCVDAGAVQTNYALSFTSPVSNVLQGAAMSPAPAVTLDESGTPFTGGSVTIPLTLNGTGTLTGGSATTSSGVATYSALKINTVGTGDSLTAQLALNAAATPAPSVSAASGTFNVLVPGPPFGYIGDAVDSVTGSTIVGRSDSVRVDGWVADPVDGAPVGNVTIYIDGVAEGTPVLGIPRPDVVAARHNSAYLNSGYEMFYSAASLKLGTHAVTVIAIDSGGRSTTFGPYIFTVAATAGAGPPIGSIGGAVDSVTGSTTVGQSDSVNVSGWVADPVDGAPLSNVKVYIDGTGGVTPTLGIARPDVAAGQHNNAYLDSGFSLLYSASSLTLGAHVVTVVAIDSGGRSTTLGPVNFTVATTAGAGPPFGFIGEAVDSVTGSTTVNPSHSLEVNGWVADATDGAPLKNVTVYIDGISKGTPTLGIPRPDVAAGQHNNAYLDSGYQMLYPVSSLAAGSHLVTVIAVDSGGRSTVFGPLYFTVE